MLIWFAVIIVTVFLDQLTKYLTVLHLKPIDTYPIIEDVFHFTYVENTGAAFGMMKDARWIFMITSTVAIIGILAYMIHRAYVKKVKMPWMEALSLSLIVGGGIGNMLDRTVLGYVVDMIDCRFIDFAVFNVADSFVCIGAGLMILYLLIEMRKELKAEKAAKLAAEGVASEATELSADETAADDLSFGGEDREDALAEDALAEDTLTEGGAETAEGTDHD